MLNKVGHSGDYAVIELQVEPHDWLAGRELRQLRLNDEGVLVLGVEQGGAGFTGAPRGRTTLAAGDTAILYGPRATLQRLDERRAGRDGNWDHHRAVDHQRQSEADRSGLTEPCD